MKTTLTSTVRRHVAVRTAFPSGVAAARQLMEFGIPERTVYRRCLEGGPWRRLLPGIVLLRDGEPTVEETLHAALLLGGPGSMITGLHACRLHGLRRGPVRRAGPGSVALLVPVGRQVRSVGFVHVERTRRLPEPVPHRGLRIAPLVRASVDAARRLESSAEITELFSDGVQRGLCTIAALAAELDSGSRRGTAMPARVLSDVAHAGVVYTATKPKRLRAEPDDVIATLRATYEQAMTRPRPAVRTVPVPVAGKPHSRRERS